MNNFITIKDIPNKVAIILEELLSKSHAKISDEIYDKYDFEGYIQTFFHIIKSYENHLYAKYLNEENTTEYFVLPFNSNEWKEQPANFSNLDWDIFYNR